MRSVSGFSSKWKLGKIGRNIRQHIKWMETVEFLNFPTHNRKAWSILKTLLEEASTQCKAVSLHPKSTALYGRHSKHLKTEVITSKSKISSILETVKNHSHTQLGKSPSPQELWYNCVAVNDVQTFRTAFLQQLKP